MARSRRANLDPPRVYRQPGRPKKARRRQKKIEIQQAKG